MYMAQAVDDIGPRKLFSFFSKWGVQPRLLHHDDAHGILLMKYQKVLQKHSSIIAYS
jgi:hypothetical protein